MKSMKPMKEQTELDKRISFLNQVQRAALYTAVLIVIGVMGSTAMPMAYAEGEGDSLIQDSQNPVGDLITMRVENYSFFNTGPNNSYSNLFNFVPVYPADLGDNWNWVHRAILPVGYVSDLGQSKGSEFGLGDVLYQGYLTPEKHGNIIWGIGPSALLPTGADAFTTDRWSLGMTAVVLAMPGDFVFGALANQVWSVDNSSNPDVSQFSLQYFVNYNLPNGWFLTSSPIIQANWEANSDNRWTVPVGGGIGKVFTIGKQALNARLQTYYNLEGPEGASDWSVHLQFTLLFKKNKATPSIYPTK